ncbi:MAG: hypothetical protein ACR2LA_11350 [Acidimicrobiales bacterium]
MNQLSALDHLRQRLGRPPAPAWRPSPGEVLTGTVAELSQRSHPEYGPYPTLIVVDEAGQHWTWCAFHHVAKDQLDQHRPAVGDLVGIAYDGRHPDRGYHLWRLVVERAPERRFDDDVAQVPRHEPFPWPPGEGPGGAA